MCPLLAGKIALDVAAWKESLALDVPRLLTSDLLVPPASRSDAGDVACLEQLEEFLA